MLWLQYKMEHQLLQCYTDRAMKFPSIKAYSKVITPNLLTATLEDLFRNFDWSIRGVSIKGNKLSNLMFADDVSISQ